ncbi:hypothetical protein GRX01_11900 [Halobaculum sp. WSA2]|uniref:Uncharacterized protein n=1 Tax=Halobaculum saliterrae TaxID=2073113 RepID=A0A6B0STZ9_9EURY|nr:hypothetical protein [Halobaculum saliterrae]MXR42037.1 hypothetical protein [Halobaculum saliterrae]
MSSEAAILGVTLNRDRLNGVTAPESFAADGEFAVALRNEGEPIHVHLRFDGPIAEVASVAPPNHYVDGGATRTVRVSVAPVNAAVEGTLDVVVGHGAERTTVPLRIDPSSTPAGDPADDDPGDHDHTDEATGEPRSGDPRASTPPEGGPSVSAPMVRRRLAEGVERVRAAAGATIDGDAAGASPNPGTLAVVALAAAALVGAGIVAVTLDGLAVTLGVVAVCVAVLVAGFLLFG